MEYRIINKQDNEIQEYHRMRYNLWPDHDEQELYNEMLKILKGKRFYKNELSWTVFVAVHKTGKLGGFIEITTYPELDFCESRPVGFIEGWYVDEKLRRSGIGKKLIEVAMEWLLKNKCTEIASDVELDNIASQKAHEKLGFLKSHVEDGCAFYKKPINQL